LNALLAVLLAVATPQAHAKKVPDPPTLAIEEGRPLSYAITLELDPVQTAFSGEVSIEVDLEGKRDFLWLNAVELDISDATISVDGRQQPVEVIEGDEEHIGLQWGRKRDGVVTLRLAYTGDASDIDTEGIFRQQEGEDRYLFTQFEAHSARKAFPCFDQPEHKVPWQITLRVPDEMGAFSNTPEASATVEDGVREVVFAQTKPLPSYLIAFAVGPFDVVDGGSAGRNDTPIRLLVPNGRGGDAVFAAEVTGKILSWQEDWFDRDYAYDKLDIVTLPLAVGFGAMENPGLVTIIASSVVVSEGDDNVERRRGYVSIMAHEVAHMWFGNQVTPVWWDDLWLNESFATWMEDKTLAGLYPEWNAEVGRVAAREGAMATDSLRTVRRIREPIVVLEDIQSAFDGITYGKGQQVLTMFEAWLGEEVFRDGVRAYLDAHEHSSATTADFVDAMSEAAGQELESVFSDFLDQPGVPLVDGSVSCDDGVVLSLSQTRYLPSGKPGKEQWKVPVCARYDAEDGPRRACTVLEGKSADWVLSDAAGCPDAVLLNDGMTGYYRSAVDAEALAVLLDADLSVGETVGLIGDAGAMVEKGRLEPGAVLSALPTLLELDEPRVTQATISVARALHDYLVPNDLRPHYEHFLKSTYGDLARELGFDPQEGDSDETHVLRGDVLSLVGSLGADPEIIAEATRRTEVWLDTGEGIHADVKGEVLSIAARFGDLELHKRLKAHTSAEEERTQRQVLLGAVAAFRQPEAATANLEWAISGEMDIREAAPLFFGAFGDADLRPLAWDFTRDNIDQLEKMLPGVARGYLIWAGAGFCTAERRADVEAFFGPRSKKYLGGKRILANVLEGIEVCEATTTAQRDEVRAFLEEWEPVVE